MPKGLSVRLTFSKRSDQSYFLLLEKCSQILLWKSNLHFFALKPRRSTQPFTVYNIKYHFLQEKVTMGKQQVWP